MDIAFNSTGTLLTSVSGDNEGWIYSVSDAQLIGKMVGHKDPISKVYFNP